jgi:hypothetical protein
VIGQHAVATDVHGIDHDVTESRHDKIQTANGDALLIRRVERNDGRRTWIELDVDGFIIELSLTKARSLAEKLMATQATNDRMGIEESS